MKQLPNILDGLGRDIERLGDIWRTQGHVLTVLEDILGVWEAFGSLLDSLVGVLEAILAVLDSSGGLLEVSLAILEAS